MTERRKVAVTCCMAIAAMVAVANRARAEPTQCSATGDAVWEPQAVRWPVDPAAVEPVAPWVVASAAEVTDPVEVTPTRAAALWMPAVAMKRLRVVRGEIADLRLSRVAGSQGSKVIVDEVGLVTTSGVELVEPIGPGSMWVIAARVPTTIVVERVDRRQPRLIWETVRDALDMWIEALPKTVNSSPARPGGSGARATAPELPTLPTEDGGAATIRLLGGRAALAAELSPVVRSAVQLWLRGQLDAIIANLRPGNDPYVAHHTHVPAGPVTTDADDEPYGPAPPVGRVWRLELSGPGVLVVDARATALEAIAGGVASVEIRRDGVAMTRVEDVVTPTMMLVPGAALPGPLPGADTGEGAELGRKIRATVPLALGTHVYEIAVNGAGLLRADVRRRRTRLREWLVDRQEREARWLLAKIATVADSTARAVAERFIASALGNLPGRPLAAITPVAVFAQLVATPGLLEPEAAKALVSTVAGLIGRSYGDLERAIVLELAERIPDSVDATPLAAALLAADPPGPPAALLSALAPHLAGGARSDAIAAAELAWREHPTVTAFRARLFSVARRTALQRVDPVQESVLRETALRWLVASDINDSASATERPSRGPAQASSVPADVATVDPVHIGSSIIELAPGKVTKLDLLPHRDEPTRLAVVRVYVATPPDQPGPVRVAFDGVAQSLVALQNLEVVEFAASAGHHDIQVDAPPATRIFVAAPHAASALPVDLTARSAAVIQRWPVDGTVVYTLPTPRAIGPVRIELVGFSEDRPRRHVVWLHSELGPPRRLVFDVREPDRNSWSLDDARAAGPAAAIWLWLPPTTRTFWLTTDDGPLYARVSVHGPTTVGMAGATVATPQNLPPPLPRIVGVDRIAQLSRSIAAQPNSAQNYVARAAALLELGDVGAARRDLAAAAPLVRREDRRAYDDARLLLGTVAEPSYLPIQPAGGRIRSGVAIGPPSTPYVPALLSLARRVRRDGAAASWAAMKRGEIKILSGLAGQHMAAAIARRAGQFRAAADHWLGLGSWQGRAAALSDLRRLIDAGTVAPAALAYGIAGELADVVTPAIQGARTAAARASRWKRISHTAANAGFESLSTAASQLDETDAVALRRALLGAPWRDAAEIVEPGRATTLSIQGPRKLAVRIWCRRLWPAELPMECQIASILDQTPAKRTTVPHGQVRSIDVDIPAGVHEIEVGLGADDPTAIAAVQFGDASSEPALAIPALRRARVFLADAKRPAEIVVAGPGAVGIEVRGYRGSTQLAEVGIVGPRDARRVIVVVDRSAALQTNASPGRDVSVTRPVTRTIVLPTAGTYRVRVAPSRDTIAVRFATRVAANPKGDRAINRQVEVANDGLPWPATVPTPALAAGTDPHERWIPSVEAVIGQDNLAALDSDFAELDFRFELAAQLRRRGPTRSWLVELRGRRVGLLGPTARLRTLAEFRRLPLGLAASIDARAAVQTSSEGALWLARAVGEVARPVQLSSRWQVVPQIALSAAAFGPDVVPYGADPMVASTYHRERPLQLVENVVLAGRPWADQYLAIGLTMRSNDSPMSVDAVGGQLMWRGLVETSPRRGGIAMLEYAPTLRFANDFRLYTFLRHDLAAELSWPWAIGGGRYGRLVVALRGDLYPPTNISQMAHAVTFRVRWDGWHPGERNRMPSEEPLSDFVDEVSWTGRR